MLIGRRGTQCKSQMQGEMTLGWHCWKSPCVRMGVWLVHHMRIRMLSTGERVRVRGLRCGEYLDRKPHPRVPCMQRDDCS